MAYNSLIVLGLPKSGTTYLSRFFLKQSAYNVIRDTSDEFHHNIVDIQKFDYSFGKNPDIILSYHKDNIFEKWIQYIDQISTKTLFLLLSRPFNDVSYSLYKHRIKYKAIESQMEYKDFLKLEQNSFLEIENNCLKAIDAIKNNKFMILSQETLQMQNTVQLLSKIGLENIIENLFPYDDHNEFVYHPYWVPYVRSRPKEQDYIFDREIEDAYVKFQNNKILQSITYKME